MANNIKAIELASANYIRVAEVDGEQVQLHARPVNPEDFTAVQLYALVATRGTVKGNVEYFVTQSDYLANKPERATSADSILAQFNRGVSADDIVAQLVAKAQARQAKKLDKKQ